MFGRSVVARMQQMAGGGRRGGLLMAVLALAAGLAPGVARAADGYVLAPGDVLAIVVQRHPEMSLASVTVPPDGIIQVPVAGAITAAGMTAAELAEAVTTRLRARLREPEVSVQIRQTRPDFVFVLGSVKNPGAYPLGPGWHVAELLASAGGLTADAAVLDGTLYRADGAAVPLDLPGVLAGGDDPELRAGDVINLSEQMITVTVTGAVARPGAYRVALGAGPLGAIAQAGGSQPRARLSEVTVSGADGRREVIDLAPAILRGEPAPAPALAEGDTVIVPVSAAAVAVLGAVRSPGSLALDEGVTMRLSDAIARVGGLTSAPAMTDAAVLRRTGERIELDLVAILIDGVTTADVPLQDGDVVSVSTRTITVRVAGQVGKPGTYQLPVGASVLAAIAEAEGVTDAAALTEVLVESADGAARQVDLLGALVHGEPVAAEPLADQDLVIVPERRSQVAVLGAVREPGLYPLPEGERHTVTQMVAEAGGAIEGARMHDVGLVRRGPDGPERISVDVSRVLREGAVDEDPLVADQDVIFVPQRTTDWDLILRALTSASLFGRLMFD